jgi:ADP-ribose pyrophosphatase
MILKETLLDSQTIYDGRIFIVRRDKLRTPSGITVLREVVEHPGAVAIVPILMNKNILMVKQYRHPPNRVLLEIPAGTLNKGEKPLDGARRELIEETGYQAGSFRKIMRCYTSPGYSSELLHIFLATGLSKIDSKMEVDELINVSEVEVHRALEMVMKNEIEDAKTICGILALSHTLLSTDGVVIENDNSPSGKMGNE